MKLKRKQYGYGETSRVCKHPYPKGNKIEPAANAFSKMDENLETKNEQAANAFSEMDEKLGNKIKPAANAFSKKE